MTILEKLLRRELYKKSFYEFTKYFWNSADPSKFVDGDLIRFYCESFQYMCRSWINYKEINVDTSNLKGEIVDIRQNKKNLCLMVPPRHSKSMIFNVLGPVWLWLSYPIKAVSISHTGALASQMNSKRHSIINSDKFREIFDDITLIANTASFLKDGRGGELYSLNRNAFTGYGGDVIINDDLTNAETARKDQAEMANAWSYYQNTMPSRVNDINKCIIMNIQQRLAPNDIAGHILNDKHLSKQYVFITLPAIFSKLTHLICPISGKVITFKKGDVLWKERFGDYQSLRYQVGETIFQTQYLQNPISTDKTVIKPYMIIEKNLNEIPDYSEADMIYASHDFPVKDKDTSDFLGSCLAYKVGSNLYIIDSLEKKMAYVRSIEYVKQLDEIYPGIIQIIEDKANGSPILQQLQDTIAGLQAFQPGANSKVQRLESASLYMESGNVILVKDEWNEETKTYQLNEKLEKLKKRLLDFPFVEHDDIVDAFSMLVLFVFMDKRRSVYTRSFNNYNIFSVEPENLYKTTFLNREGDLWKALTVGIDYSNNSLYCSNEKVYKGNSKEVLDKLKAEYQTNVFIDVSYSDVMQGIYTENVYLERYEITNFEKSVQDLELAFSKKLIKVKDDCHLTKSDIEMFKFSKSKTNDVKYQTEKDGFVACIRGAMKYYGGII